MSGRNQPCATSMEERTPLQCESLALQPQQQCHRIHRGRLKPVVRIEALRLIVQGIHEQRLHAFPGRLANTNRRLLKKIACLW